jgi:hypothetical protein
LGIITLFFFSLNHELLALDHYVDAMSHLSKSAIGLLIGIILTQPFDGAPQTSFVSART